MNETNVLVLQHVPYEGQAYIADYMQRHDIAFDVVRLWEPYAPAGQLLWREISLKGPGPFSVL